MFRVLTLRQRPSLPARSAARNLSFTAVKWRDSTKGTTGTSEPSDFDAPPSSSNAELTKDEAAFPRSDVIDGGRSLELGFKEEKESLSDLVKRRGGSLSVSALATLDRLGVQLNKVTGYEEIEALKNDVAKQGTHWRL